MGIRFCEIGLASDIVAETLETVETVRHLRATAQRLVILAHLSPLPRPYPFSPASPFPPIFALITPLWFVNDVRLLQQQ